MPGLGINITVNGLFPWRMWPWIATTNRVSASPITADVSNNARINAAFLRLYLCRVEVDLATCKVEVLKIYSVHDAGKIINPQLAEAQVHSRVSMGLGYACQNNAFSTPQNREAIKQ